MDEHDWEDDFDEPSGADEYVACPECGADVYADAEACSRCGYWLTDADHAAAWHANSATGRIKTFGLWLIGIAVLLWLVL